MAVLIVGYAMQVDFDTIRTAAVEICRGAALTAAVYVLALYEPLREPFDLPRTQGQTQELRE